MAPAILATVRNWNSLEKFISRRNMMTPGFSSVPISRLTPSTTIIGAMRGSR